jgi:hypothetical protein
MEQFKISRALGLSFRSWFRNFLPFTALAAVLYSPVAIWFAVVTPDPDADAAALLDPMFTYPLYMTLAASTLLAPLITFRVIQELDGRKVSLLASVKFGLRGLLPAAFFAVVSNVLGQIPVVGGLLGTILVCIYFVTTPAAVAERLNPFAAFTRSAELTRGRRWGIFGLSFLLGLMVVCAIAFRIVPILQAGSSVTHEMLRSASIGVIAILAVFQLLNGIVQAVSYALLRQDKEGISHAELAQIFG